jgi:serine phosphatase RsbU (regulator of sigma subunit)/anti-anti-sigma regulatory factor
MSDAPQNTRILVVDDDAVIRTVLVAALKRGGYPNVETASGGRAAQQLLRTGGFDLVITDISMPDLDGLALMRWALETVPGPAWMILSGDTTFQNAVAAVKLGAFDYISKPLTEFDSFLVSVRNALRQRQLLADQALLTQELASQVTRMEQALHLLSTQAEIIRLDLQRAELIQRALLPDRPPRLGRFAFNALYRASHKVGGDLYDVLPIDERTYAFYVADAAGHGISAAMVAVLFKLSLVVHDEKTGAPVSPAQVLAAVNARVFRECAAPGLFITAALCVLDIETGELTVASGGHTPLLLQRAGHELEYIPRTGPALGLAGDQTYGTFTTRLGTGDRLLLYTDGLTDPRTNAREFSLIELGALLAAPADSPQARLNRLAAEVYRRTGTSLLEDDLTLVLISDGAFDSAVDNGAALPGATWGKTPAEGSSSAGAFMARRSETAFFRLTGRCVWSQAGAFHEACSAELAEGRTVVVDLDGCDYMDSTFLGTLHELATASGTRGVLVLQRMSSDLRRLCEELCLQRVLQLVAVEARPLPADFSPLHPLPLSSDRGRERMLAAHEVLATLHEDNQARFSGVIEELRRTRPAARESS